MIRVAIHNKSFGGTPVLGEVQFTLSAGETLAIAGASGIGKTTFLRIIAGLDRNFQGEVVVPEKVAMVFQEPALLPWRCVRANIMLATGVSRSQADAALKEVGLEGLSERFPGQLSLGQQRRLSLARAFSAAPDLLLMDEPFVSLDPPLAADMLALTEQMLARRKIATVLVTHNPQEGRRLATRAVRFVGHPARLENMYP